MLYIIIRDRVVCLKLQNKKKWASIKIEDTQKCSNLSYKGSLKRLQALYYDNNG